MNNLLVLKQRLFGAVGPSAVAGELLVATVRVLVLVAVAGVEEGLVTQAALEAGAARLGVVKATHVSQEVLLQEECLNKKIELSAVFRK